MFISSLTFQQSISLLSALILFSSIILIIQKKISGLIQVFVAQSFILALAAFFQAIIFRDYQIYASVLIIILLKVVLIPWFLRYVVRLLNIENEAGSINHPFYILLGSLAIVIFCYHIVTPMTLFPSLITKNVVAIAMSVMLLGMLLMITRKNAVAHVIGFMVMENGLFFVALMATRGMPMVVELGIAFDLLVAVALFGVFFFHIRSNIESMDVDSLNRLREDIE